MKKHYQIILKGNFKQCGFRFHTLQTAHDFSICGQITEQNSNIIIEAEGDEQNMEKFLQWCYSLKGVAAPESIMVVKKPLAYYDEFKIL